MKIAVYSKDKVSTFQLPIEMVGNYSFDVSSSEQKIINLIGEEDKWILHQTSDTKIISGNQQVDKVALADNTFYTLKRKDVNYLVYSYNNNKVNVYKYDKTMSLIIGNGNGANIDYNCIFLKAPITISYVNDKLMLKKDASTLVYVNRRILLSTEEEIKIGDEVDIFGLKINFLSESLLSINLLPGLVIDAVNTSHLSTYKFESNEEVQVMEIEDVDLYNPDDYYSKSPRLRRNVEPKVFKLNPPPNAEKEVEKTPALLVIGPMITMGMTSFITMGTTLLTVSTQKTSITSSLPQLIISVSMIFSMFIWPYATKAYNKSQVKKARKKAIKNYTKYLEKFENDVTIAQNSQRVIVDENLLTLDDCIKSIETKGMNFWDKRMDQNDFLYIRVGLGEDYNTCVVQYEAPDQIEDIDDEEDSKKKNKKKETAEAKKIKELAAHAKEMANKYSKMDNMPIGYSFLNNPITAVMGSEKKQIGFINNVLLQLLTYYSYDDLKIVILTSEANASNWDYIKYLNHNFSNSKNIRFFGEDQSSINRVLDYLNYELNNRMQQEGISKPYYLIVCDQYDKIKRSNFIKVLTEMNTNVGFSLIIAENKLNKLPSKCNSFITLGNKTSDILINNFESQQHISFQDEIRYDIDMNKLSKILANIPVELSSADSSQLPESITFLEMENVGRVEHLNILNRWKNNDAINTLKAEVGVDENGEELYLDIHEKAHGPHGLIAGTTGSGKSEFIITYILSLAINYSPEDVAFILIDYKGGGLAYAFENKQTGVCLPHLSGTITNLDKAEMDRTLVSINSEIKRRQKIFNEARDALGESTMDIYKYQGLYREGKLQEAVPHLLIICDEFAELKSQQPDFMDNLISVARIGRSLGVHLILATQKPSGVVNDQIWSNSKFKVCLKVQDESDSKEMLKRPDAANIKEAGRFYLQVGFDEYFVLGQSGWSGAKYYPQDEIIKVVDKSINFIGPSGNRIKNIQAGTKKKGPAEGEQIAAVMKDVITLANQVNIHANKLWLENIPEMILDDELIKKYNIQIEPYKVEGIIGEYDAPEAQQQGLVKYDYVNDGNAVIYGTDGTEREMLINSLIYTTTNFHTASEVQLYIADFGSESLKRFERLPQVGGVVVTGEDEKFNNLIKMLKEEIKDRKKLFANYGGEFTSYNDNTQDKKPLILVIFNNYDSINEAYNTLYDTLPEVLRDSDRYGVVFIFTANASNSIQTRISKNFKTKYALKMNDSSEYSSIFDQTVKKVIRNYVGRGLVKHDTIHEFQVANIIEDPYALNDFINGFVDFQLQKSPTKAKRIPILPDKVTINDLVVDKLGINNVPLGINKNTLEVSTFDFTLSLGTVIAANRLANAKSVVKGFISVFKTIQNSALIIFDPLADLELNKKDYPNYYTADLENIIEKITKYIDGLIEKKSNIPGVILMYNVSKLVDKVTSEKLEKLITSLKKYEHMSAIIVESSSKLSKLAYEKWYQGNFSNSDGIWIGKGVTDQNVLRLTSINKELTKEVKNNMGCIINENSGELCKFIESGDSINGGNEDEK